MFPEGAFGLRDSLRNLDLHDHVQIAPPVAVVRKTFSPDAEALAVLGAGRDFDIDSTIQGGNGYLRSQDRLPRGDFRLVDEIMILDLEVGMSRQPKR